MDEPTSQTGEQPGPEELKRALIAEIDDSRTGIQFAADHVRLATDFRSRFKNALPQPLISAVKKNPLPIAAGFTFVGFLVARRIFRPTHSNKVGAIAAPATTISLAILLKQLLFSSAGFLLKPAIKEFLAREVSNRFAQRSQSRHL